MPLDARVALAAFALLLCACDSSEAGDGTGTSSGQCAPDENYDRGTQRCLPGAAAGESCGERPCGQAYWCDESDGICRVYVPLGGPCGDDAPCVPDARCNADGICAAGGQIEAGGQCALVTDCAAPNICHLSEGVCGPPGEVGDPCGYDDSECAAGLACIGSVGPVCQEVGREGDPCMSPEACAHGLECFGRDGRCHLPRERDQPCSDHAPCAAPLGCFPRADTGETTCGPRRIAGSGCTVTADCEYPLQCLPRTDGELVCREVRQFGEACNPDLAHDCGAGLVCPPDGTPGARECAIQGGAGTPCSDRTQCTFELTCRFDAVYRGTCAPRGTAGEPCGLDEDCRMGLECRADTPTGLRTCR